MLCIEIKIPSTSPAAFNTFPIAHPSFCLNKSDTIHPTIPAIRRASSTLGTEVPFSIFRIVSLLTLARRASSS